MAIPVITSPLLLETPTHVAIDYKIAATNFPTSFNASGLPLQLAVNTATGRIHGRVKTPGSYTVHIEATNGDGVGSANLDIEATDNGGQDQSGPIAVYQSKFWADSQDTELLDFADLDAAAQPVVAYDANVLGTLQLSADAISKKMTQLGGPGRVFQHVFPTAFTSVSGTRITQLLATMEISAVGPSDFVVMGELLDANGVYLGPTVSRIQDAVFFGVATVGQVGIYAWNLNAAAIPANARINFRLFGYPGA